MERIEYESVWLFGPEFANVFVRRETFEGLQAAGEIVCGDEVVEMRSQLRVRFIEVALNGRFLDCAVHALDLAIGPRMLGLGQPMIDIGAGAGELEGMRPEGSPFRLHLLDFRRGPGLAAGIGTVRSIIREHRVDFVGNGFDQREQEVGGDPRSTKANFDVRSIATNM